MKPHEGQRWSQLWSDEVGRRGSLLGAVALRLSVFVPPFLWDDLDTGVKVVSLVSPSLPPSALGPVEPPILGAAASPWWPPS